VNILITFLDHIVPIGLAVAVTSAAVMAVRDGLPARREARRD